MKAFEKNDELKKRFLDIPNNLDAVNIGSGPSFYDFDWSAIPEILGYNMAISPEDFRYDARIIKHYGNHVKRGGVVVVVVVCPLSFGENDYLYKDSFSEKYVSILSASDVDLPKWKYSLYKNFPIFLKCKKIILRVLRGLCRRLQKFFSRKKNYTLSPIEALVNGWISNNKYLNDLKNPNQADYYRDVFKEKESDLKKVVDNCCVQELKPVVVIPPMSSGLRANISDEFIKSFVYDNLKSIADGGTPILDYIDDKRFNDESYYSNGLFLTPEKRKDFTKTVWEDIKNIYNHIAEA